MDLSEQLAGLGKVLNVPLALEPQSVSGGEDSYPSGAASGRKTLGTGLELSTVVHIYRPHESIWAMVFLFLNNLRVAPEQTHFLVFEHDGSGWKERGWEEDAWGEWQELARFDDR